jgi:hypothetical protein
VPAMQMFAKDCKRNEPRAGIVNHMCPRQLPRTALQNAGQCPYHHQESLRPTTGHRDVETRTARRLRQLAAPWRLRQEIRTASYPPMVKYHA